MASEQMSGDLPSADEDFQVRMLSLELDTEAKVVNSASAVSEALGFAQQALEGDGLLRALTSRARTSLISACETLSSGTDHELAVALEFADDKPERYASLSKQGSSVLMTCSPPVHVAKNTSPRLHHSALNTQKLSDLLKLAPVTVWEADTNGTIQVYQGKGREDTSAVGTSVLHRFSDVPEFADRFRQALIGTPGHFEVLTRGEYLECHLLPQIAEDGRITAVTGLSVNVTDRASAIHKARESQEEALSLLETTVDGVITTDEKGKILSMNPAASELFGYPAEEVIGRNVKILMPESVASQHDGYMKSYRHGAVPRVVGLGREVVGIHRNGEERPIHLALSEYSTDGRRRFLGILRDMREEVMRRERLSRAETMIAVGHFAGGLAHEYNNVLGAITGYTSLGRRRCADNERLLGYFEKIEVSARRANELTTHLVAISRADTKTKQSLELGSVLERSAKLLKRVIREDISLEAHVSGERLDATTNQGSLDHALLTLAFHARDAMPKGGRLDYMLEPCSFDDEFTLTSGDVLDAGSYGKLSVVDDGPILQASYLGSLFAGDTIVSAGEGSRWGVATLFSALKEQGISLDTSIVDGRFAMVLYIPLSGAPVELLPATEIESQLSPGGDVVIVDDDQQLLELMNEILTDAGYTCHAYDKPSKVIEELAEKGIEPDALVCDVVTPEISGPDVAKRFHETYPNANVLFITGYTHELVARRVQSVGDFPILLKPFKPRALLDALRGQLPV